MQIKTFWEDELEVLLKYSHNTRGKIPIEIEKSRQVQERGLKWQVHNELFHFASTLGREFQINPTARNQFKMKFNLSPTGFSKKKSI